MSDARDRVRRVPSRTARGRAAEDVCAEYLFARGFRLLARNLRLGRLELDIVARKGPLVAVVEVRTRGTTSFARPFASVTYEKRNRLLLGAERLLRRERDRWRGVERLRIDVAAVKFDAHGATIEYADGAVVRGFA